MLRPVGTTPVQAGYTAAGRGLDPGCIAPAHDARVPDLASDRGAAADRRARVIIALCALCPVLVGLVVTAGTTRAAPAPPPRLAGHWVYVPGLAAAVHVDGASKQVDATVPLGAASPGSPVLQGGHAGYLVDVDRVVEFGPAAGVTGGRPGPGVAETPVPVEAAAAAHLVYRAAGLVVRLSPEPATVTAGGPLSEPVAARDGTLWVLRADTGEVCGLGPGETALSCPARVPAGHRAGLSLLGGHPVLLDITAATVQPVDRRGAGEPTRLGLSLPPNALLGPADAGGRLPVLDPGGRRLLLLRPDGDAVAVPVGRGRFDRPVSGGDAVVLVDQDSGRVVSVDSRGRTRGAAVIPTGGIRTTRGEDGRVYADATDGRQSVVMDGDGTLTAVAYGGPAPTYRSPVPVPPTTTPAPTTTPPPAPTTATPPTPDPTTTAPPAADPTTAAPATTRAPATPATPPPTTRAPAPTSAPTPTRTPSQPGGAEGGTGVPTVDVLAARATGATEVTLRLRVTGGGPVFCHVYVNSVERAALPCAGTREVPVGGLCPALYDVYVLGTNARGTGQPGRRVQVRLP